MAILTINPSVPLEKHLHPIRSLGPRVITLLLWGEKGHNNSSMELKLRLLSSHLELLLSLNQ